jgi:ribosomal protein L7/L12
MNEKIEKLMEEVKALTVLELNELVKALEEEFGVTAAAPVAAAVTPNSSSNAFTNSFNSNTVRAFTSSITFSIFSLILNTSKIYFL